MEPISGQDTARTSGEAVYYTALVGIAVAVLVTGLKFLAYVETGSVALYSDALESIVNVLTAIAAVLAVRVSRQPADSNHPFGHHKAEYLSAVLEGALIIVAAILIFREAFDALLHSTPIGGFEGGLVYSGLATLLNAGWAYYLIVRGKTWRSAALVADGWHIASDVVTTLGVVLGLGLATLTGFSMLDPLMAMAVALYILTSGYKIAMRSMSGLLDEAVDPEIEKRIHEAIRTSGKGAIEAHEIRTRHAGRVTFIEFHLVVPSAMSVYAAHEICDRLEAALESEIEGSDVVIHLEPEHKAWTTKPGVVKLAHSRHNKSDR